LNFLQRRGIQNAQEMVVRKDDLLDHVVGEIVVVGIATDPCYPGQPNGGMMVSF
jgi:hypothetical protein